MLLPLVELIAWPGAGRVTVSALLERAVALAVSAPAASRGGSEDRSMKDLAYVVLTLIFFIASWLYVKGLERL